MEIYWTEFEEPITWPFFLVWFGGSEQIPTNQSHQKKLNRLGYLLMSLWKLSLAFGIIVVQSTDSQCHFKCSTSPLAHLTRPNMSEYSPFPSFPAMAETCWDPIPSTVRPGTLQATWTEPPSFHSSPPLTAEAHLATGCLWRHQEFGGMYGWFCSRIDCKIHLLTYFILV